MKRTKQKAEETRQAILNSALDLFYQKGYSKTTFEGIAQQISLSKGAVYWHFKNKPDLLVALINQYIEIKHAYLSQKMNKISTLDDVRRYFLCMVDFILSDSNCTKLAFFLSLQMEWSEAIITKVMTAIGKSKKDHLEYLKDCLTLLQKGGEIRRDFDVNILADILLNLWTGTLEAYFSKRSTIDLKTMVEKNFDLMINGLKERIENVAH